MRKVIIKEKWLIDIMFLERSSYKLHLFALLILRNRNPFIRTPYQNTHAN